MNNNSSSTGGTPSSIMNAIVGVAQRNPRLSRGDRDGRLSKMNRFNGSYSETISLGKQQGRKVTESKENTQQNRQYESSKSDFKLTAHSESSSMSHMYKHLNESTLDSTESSIGIGSSDQISHIEEQMHSTKDVIVAGILIALIVVFTLNFLFLVYQPAVRLFRRYFGRIVNENKTLVELRYKTIDKWLIQKTVQPHDKVCKTIQNYTRLDNGDSSLGKHTDDDVLYGSSPLNLTHQTKELPSPLRLTSSFDTNSTHDCSGCDGGASSFFNDGDELENSVPNDKIEVLNRDDSLPRNFSKTGDVSITAAPDDFVTECYECQHEFDSNISDENTITKGRSFFLTREQILDKVEITKANNKTVSDERDNNPRQECSICMESFKIGDKISFSPAKGCHHVFHHDCLRTWLLRKTDCPCCRVTMLPVDRPNPRPCGEQCVDEESQASQNISSEYRRNRRVTLPFFQTTPPKIKKPWYHKNTSVLNERLNKKCSTFCCVCCGVVVLKTNLREDLCTKIPKP